MTESFEFPPFETSAFRANGDTAQDPQVKPPIPLGGDLLLGGGRGTAPPPTLPAATPFETVTEARPPAQAAPPPVPDPAGEEGVRITLWGGSSSGKTTYLGALPFAIQQARTNPRYGSWMLTPLNDGTHEFQAETTTTLDTARTFPPPTSVLESGLSWRLRGRVHEGGLAGLRRGVRQARGRQEEDTFTLNVPDVPGEWFGGGDSIDDMKMRREGVFKAQKETLTRELARSHGIVYLFDPTAELAAANSFQYLHDLLSRLQMQIEQEGRIRDNRLPHYVAICVTKFDTKWVLDRALEARLVKQDQHGQPAVPQENAEVFFDLLCRTLGPSGQNVANALKAAFHPKRTMYFVTSAVGFRRGPDGTGFDMAQPSQINPAVGGVQRIMDQIRPINVLEPLVELERLYRSGGHR
ncbi:MAG TPA: hypothetical protein VGX23_05545 [Actinocrinis sp.]|nr:hypothetical protein [Actinocrinis sp.]